MMAVLKSVWIFSNLIWKVTDMADKLIKSAPIIPLPSWATSLAGLEKWTETVIWAWEDRIAEINNDQTETFLKNIGMNNQNKQSKWTQNQINENLEEKPTFKDYHSTQKTVQNSPSFTSAQKLATDTQNTNYTTSTAMSNAIQEMSNNMDQVLNHLKGSKEWEQKLRQLADGYKHFSGKELQQNTNDGLVDVSTLSQGFKSPEFRNGLANAMYASWMPKYTIDQTLNLFKSDNPTDNTNSSFIETFWKDKAKWLQNDITEGKAQPIKFDAGTKIYYRYGSQDSTSKMRIATLDKDTISELYTFQTDNTVNQISDQTKIQLNTQSDYQQLWYFLSYLNRNNIDTTIDWTNTNNATHILYPFRDHKDMIEKLLKDKKTSIVDKNNKERDISIDNDQVTVSDSTKPSGSTSEPSNVSTDWWSNTANNTPDATTIQP